MLNPNTFAIPRTMSSSDTLASTPHDICIPLSYGLSSAYLPLFASRPVNFERFTAGRLSYIPNRVRTPLRRTNPEKGLGIDPGWVPISWDEALDELEKKLTKVRKEDPRKLKVTSFHSPFG